MPFPMALIAAVQGIADGMIASPSGLPWAAWAVGLSLVVMLLGLGVHGVAVAVFLGRLSEAVKTQGAWLSEVSTNTRQTSESVAALNATLAEKVITAEKEHQEFRRTDDDICDRITAVEDRERARLENQGRQKP